MVKSFTSHILIDSKVLFPRYLGEQTHLVKNSGLPGRFRHGRRFRPRHSNAADCSDNDNSLRHAYRPNCI